MTQVTQEWGDTFIPGLDFDCHWGSTTLVIGLFPDGVETACFVLLECSVDGRIEVRQCPNSYLAFEAIQARKP